MGAPSGTLSLPLSPRPGRGVSRLGVLTLEPTWHPLPPRAPPCSAPKVGLPWEKCLASLLGPQGSCLQSGWPGMLSHAWGQEWGACPPAPGQLLGTLGGEPKPPALHSSHRTPSREAPMVTKRSPLASGLPRPSSQGVLLAGPSHSARSLPETRARAAALWGEAPAGPKVPPPPAGRSTWSPRWLWMWALLGLLSMVASITPRHPKCPSVIP